MGPARGYRKGARNKQHLRPTTTVTFTVTVVALNERGVQRGVQRGVERGKPQVVAGGEPQSSQRGIADGEGAARRGGGGFAEVYVLEGEGDVKEVYFAVGAYELPVGVEYDVGVVDAIWRGWLGVVGGMVGGCGRGGCGWGAGFVHSATGYPESTGSGDRAQAL